MIAAALTQNLSHYSATGHMGLAAWSIASHKILIFFPNYLFPLALDRRRKCANIITYRSGSLNTLAQVYCTSLHFLSSPHSSKELMSCLNPCPWSWPLKEWQKLSFWLLGLWNAPYRVIDMCAWIQPVHVHTYLMRAAQCRSWPPDALQSPSPVVGNALEASLGLNLWHRLMPGYQVQWKQCWIRIWSSPGVPCLD